MGRKIGIITFHFCLNYGAVLQCYALVNYFKEKGVDVYTLNAVSRKQEKNNSMYRGKTGLKKLIRNTVLLPLHYKRIKKEKKFKSFVESELNCTERVSTAESLKDLINKKNYDYIMLKSCIYII